MSIEKSIYAAPQGLGQTMGQDFEVEIEDPNAADLGDPAVADGEPFDANLAEYIPESILTQLAGDLLGDYESDLDSRRDWVQTYVDGIELLGLKIEERSEPWEGACGVYHPILAEAVVKFQSETIMATFPAAGPCKGEIIGKESQDAKEAMDRVVDDMNFQLTDNMIEYRSEHERMLWGTGLSGNGFKKIYIDPGLDRQTSIYIPAEDIVVPYGASRIETAERVTHVMRKTENEVLRLQLAGFYREMDLGEPDTTLDDIEKKIAEKLGFRATSDDRYKLLEMHVNVNLQGYEHTNDDGEETGLELPYVVTIDKNSTSVLSVRRNWKEGDKTHQKRQHFVKYGYIPGFGFYDFGLIHILGAYAKSGTSILRQLVDAGSLSNLPGGFKTRGLRVKGDDTPIAPGEFRDVDVPSGTMKDNIMPLPYKEPSQVLAGLMDKIIDEARRFASAGDLQVSDMSANAPVGSTLAILERQLKTMSAIQARIHFSMKQEFKLLKEIIADYAPEDYAYEPVTGSQKARKSDYQMVNINPVSDPNASTMAQKIVQYQAVIQLSQSAPQIYDLPFLHREMLDALGINNAEKLVKLPEDEKPTDPVTENVNALTMKPLKAFSFQDHESHIKIHIAALQDPKIKQIIGQNPQAPAIMSALQSHITEHVALEYKRQIEQTMGFSIPENSDEYKMTPDVEAQISRAAVPAAQQLLNQNQTEQAAKAAQQAQNDPIVQMQMKELQLKSQEVDIKMKKLQMEAAGKADQMEIEKQRIAAQKEIAGMQIGAKIQSDRANLAAKQQIEELKQRTEGVRIGNDAGKAKAQMNQQRQMERTRMGIDAAKHITQMDLQREQAKQQTKEPSKKETK